MINWLKTSFGQIGKSATFFYICDKILRKIKIGSLYPYCFFAQSITENTVKTRLSPKIIIRQIKPNEPVLLEILPLSVCQNRFSQKAICIGAFNENKLSALLWLTSSVFYEDEVRANFMPPPGCCWDFGVHIEPEYRMTRTFLTLWNGSCQIMRHMNFHHSLSRISAFNPSSLKAHKRMGARLLGKAVFLNIGPVQFTFSTLKPKIHISLVQKSRVIFYFNITP